MKFASAKNCFLCLTIKRQTDSVALGTPLGPALANIFSGSFENKCLKDCPHGLKPVFHRWCVTDIMQKSLRSIFYPDTPT